MRIVNIERALDVKLPSAHSWAVPYHIEAFSYSPLTFAASHLVRSLPNQMASIPSSVVFVIYIVSESSRSQVMAVVLLEVIGAHGKRLE